jgi:hypothetical protein
VQQCRPQSLLLSTVVTGVAWHFHLQHCYHRTFMQVNHSHPVNGHLRTGSRRCCNSRLESLCPVGISCQLREVQRKSHSHCNDPGALL